MADSLIEWVRVAMDQLAAEGRDVFTITGLQDRFSTLADTPAQQIINTLIQLQREGYPIMQTGPEDEFWELEQTGPLPTIDPLNRRE